MIIPIKDRRMIPPTHTIGIAGEHDVEVVSFSAPLMKGDLDLSAATAPLPHGGR